MVKREVVWTISSKKQLRKILEFYTERNKSNKYSQRLFNKFKENLQIAAQSPEIGAKTKLENIRGLIVDDYILFYEIFKNKIIVLKVWDCRQDPDKLNIPR